LDTLRIKLEDGREVVEEVLELGVQGEDDVVADFVAFLGYGSHCVNGLAAEAC
jgi:hypothetical protein